MASSGIYPPIHFGFVVEVLYVFAMGPESVPSTMKVNVFIFIYIYIIRIYLLKNRLTAPVKWAEMFKSIVLD